MTPTRMLVLAGLWVAFAEGEGRALPWGSPAPWPSGWTAIGVVRTAFAPLLVVPLDRLGSGRDVDGAEYLGGASPAAFGLPSGRLQVVATAPSRGLVVVEIGGPEGGAMFALPVRDGVGGRPVRIAREVRADFDVALDAPEGRLVFVGAGGLVVAFVAALEADARPPVVVVPRPTEPGERLERPRFVGDEYLVYERSRTPPRGGATTSVIEIVRADGASPPRVLLAPAAGSQDRTPVVFDADRLLVYRKGVLHFADHGTLTPLAPHFAGHALTGDAFHRAAPQGAGDAPVVLVLGGGGERAARALATVDATGVVRRLTEARPMYLEALVAPDGLRLVVSTAPASRASPAAAPSNDANRTARWVVEEVRWSGEVRALTPPGATPIQLVAWDASGRWVAGCRGHEVVVVDSAHPGPARVVASIEGQPACTVRAIAETERGPVVVFEPRDEDASRPAVVSVAGGAIQRLPRKTHVVGVLGGALVLSSWDHPARIVARAATADLRVAVLVPWEREGIPEAYLTRDVEGRPVVVYRLGQDADGGESPRWWAIRADGRGGVPVHLNGRGRARGRLLGFVRGWMVFHEGSQCIGFRLDGRDATGPVVLHESVEGAELASRAGRLVVRTRHGDEVAIVAVPIDAAGAGAGVAVLRSHYGSIRAFDVDEAAGTVVALAGFGSASGSLLVAALDGHEAATPRVVPIPQAQGASAADGLGFDRGGPIDVLAPGDGTARVLVRGRDMHMSSLPPVFRVVVRLDGKTAPAAAIAPAAAGLFAACERLHGSFAPCPPGGVDPDPSGAETFQPLGRAGGW